MKKNGYTVIELSIFLGVFSVIYFVTIVILSGNFKVDYKEKSYEQKIAAIKTQAVIYAKSKEDFFKEDNSVYITIGELASESAINSGKDGKVFDPRNPDNTLNDLKVKIVNKDDNITAEVLG